MTRFARFSTSFINFARECPAKTFFLQGLLGHLKFLHIGVIKLEPPPVMWIAGRVTPNVEFK